MLNEKALQELATSIIDSILDGKHSPESPISNYELIDGLYDQLANFTRKLRAEALRQLVPILNANKLKESYAVSDGSRGFYFTPDEKYPAWWSPSSCGWTEPYGQYGITEHGIDESPMLRALYEIEWDTEEEL